MTSNQSYSSVQCDHMTVSLYRALILYSYVRALLSFSMPYKKVMLNRKHYHSLSGRGLLWPHLLGGRGQKTSSTATFEPYHHFQCHYGKPHLL